MGLPWDLLPNNFIFFKFITALMSPVEDIKATEHQIVCLLSIEYWPLTPSTFSEKKDKIQFWPR